MLWEPFREKELAEHLARIFPAQHRWSGAERLVFHWQHDVVVAQTFFEDDARNILFVETLHDDHDCGFVRIVQTSRNSLQKPVKRGRTHLVRGSAFHRVRVVDDDSVATSTRDPTSSHSLSETSRSVFELGFCVLVACQRDTVAPKRLIPFGLNQSAHLCRVTDCKLLTMGGTNISQMRHIAWPPFPSWPKDVGQQRLHCARWDVYQQTIVILFVVNHHFVSDGGQMRRDHVDVPVVDIFLARLNHVPCLFYKINKVFFAVRFVQQEQQLFGRVAFGQFLYVISNPIMHQSASTAVSSICFNKAWRN